MSKVVSFDQPTPNTFAVNYLVSAEEFAKIKEEGIAEAIKDVKVKGYRKGKVPRDVALKQVDPVKLESLILGRLFKAYEKPAIEAGLEQLKTKDRLHTSISVNFKDGATKELEDGSFQFQIVFYLLPQIDVDKIASIKVREFSPSDIQDRPSLEEFVQREKNRIFCEYNRYEETDTPSQLFHRVKADLVGKDGQKEIFVDKNIGVLLGLGLFLPEVEKHLTGVRKGDKLEFNVNYPKDYSNTKLAGKKVQITATVHSVLAPQYTDLAEVFEKSKQASQLKKQFGKVEDVDKVLAEVYNREISRILQSARQREIIKGVMEAVPDFELNEDLVAAETNRMLENLKQRAQENKLKLGEELIRVFPNISAEDPAAMSDEQIRAELEKQIRDEFKWANILSSIYQIKVTDKPKPEDFDQVKAAAVKEPERYGFDKKTPRELIENAIVDRIVRQVAFTWISNLIDKSQSKSVDVEHKSKAPAEKNTAVESKTGTKTKSVS